MNLTVDALLHGIRVGHLGRCINDCRDLLALLRRLRTTRVKDVILHEIELKCDVVATNLATKRVYMQVVPGSSNDNPVCRYDPRFLVFEFIHNLMLRESQVRIIIFTYILYDMCIYMYTYTSIVNNKE